MSYKYRIPIIITTIIVLLITLAVGIFFLLLSHAYDPTPDSERNLSEENVTMYLDVQDEAGREAIVRTFKKSDYDNFSVSKKNRILDAIGGNIEGDIPALKLSKGRSRHITFKDTSSGELVSLDNAPSHDTTMYSSGMLPIGEDEFNITPVESKGILSEDKGSYLYTLEQNMFDGLDDGFDDGSDYGFNCVALIQISYKIDGVEYISLTAINIFER